MNDHGLTKENLLSALPAALREDASIAALAEAAAELLALRREETDRLTLYPAIDRLEEPVLDALAWDFKVDWWDMDFSLEEKRRLLKRSWQVHKLLGTKAGLEKAVSAIYPDARAQEWFEYGGEPHHFRIRLGEATQAITPDSQKKFSRAMGCMKRLSSHLDEVWADCKGRMTAYHALTSAQFLELSGGDALHAGANRYIALSGSMLREYRGSDAFPGGMVHAAALTGTGLLELHGNDALPAGMPHAAALTGAHLLELYAGGEKLE